MFRRRRDDTGEPGPDEAETGSGEWEAGPWDAGQDVPSLELMEKRYLAHVLVVLKGNRPRAAEVLGIDRRTLYRMMERFGMDGEQEK